MPGANRSLEPARVRRIGLFCAIALLLAHPALGQEAPAFELTVPSIMRGPELVGTPPARVTWTDDSRWVYFLWKPGGRPWSEDAALYRVSAGGGTPERLSEARADSLAPLLARGDISRDRRWRVVSSRGDLWLVDRRSLALQRLTATATAERHPVFSGDARRIYFIADQNVYRLDRETGELRQLTDIEAAAKPAEKPEPSAQRQFLAEQQKELFAHIRRTLREEEEREAREKARREVEGRPEIRIGAGERVAGIDVDPSGAFAVLRVMKPARDGRATLVPDYVTESGYTETIRGRENVGDLQAEGRMGLLDLATGELRWLHLRGPGAAADSAAADSSAGAAPDAAPAAGGAREAAAATGAGADSAGAGRPPHHSAMRRKGKKQQRPALAAVAFLGWSADGSRGLLASVAYDYKDQWLWALDPKTGELTELAHDHDDAWIDGPCGPWSGHGCAGWLPDGGAAWFLSERDGYSHLYTVPASGGEPRQLTKGKWEVKAAEIAPDRRSFLLETSYGSPFERHADRLPLSGGELVRLTTAVGFSDATPSPDGKRLAVVHSSANRPPELYLMENRRGAELNRITTSPTAEWLSFPWIRPEIIRFPARDGTSVPARVYRPSDLGARANGAAVIFVHGAGYLHNVHEGWSTYYREYMFHHLLARRGFTVLDIDYRGSAGYGRDWRTAVYRHMGGKDLSDQVDGARWLVAHEGVDPARIGIYGGSYGGFITLMALFTEPDAFGAGAALRAVTDWAHYNHWYTSRILNLPDTDEEAYRQSSPIYFAEGLKAPLLIAHGMVDTNVHFQDVVRLTQRLIELGKTDWQLAVYPVESHGFVEPTSWTDEYRRILKLFESRLGSGAGSD